PEDALQQVEPLPRLRAAGSRGPLTFTVRQPEFAGGSGGCAWHGVCCQTAPMIPHDHVQPHDLTPDLLTPVQYYSDTLRRQGSGVRRLMAALLEDAAHTYSRN